VNVAVAATAPEAERLALPQLLAMLTLRTGGPLGPQRLVEEAEDVAVPEQHERLLAAMRERWIIADPEAAARRVLELAVGFDVDEVMVHPVAGAYAGTDPAAAPARVESLRLLAEALDGLDW
jgi:alkanesulfonate monooxygenase SsuD/methylene tetrahydromethanopterin reductase-like flavin-dependent oxidoreductase (luciferase family)